MAAVRAFLALVMVGALAAASARVSAAQVDGDTFTAQEFDWSITWDDSVWEVTEDGAVNEDGFDAINLSSDDVGFVFIIGFSDPTGDLDGCMTIAAENIEGRDGVDDFEPSDELPLPDAPRGAEQAVYAYTFDTGDGEPFDVAEYVECRILIEGEAVMQISYQTLAAVYEDALPLFEELLEGLEVEGGAATGDEDEDETRTTEDEEENDRDVSLGDDEDEDGGTTGTTEDDEEEEDAGADSGIDGNAYESPTYGYTLEWDEDVWEADPADEVVDDNGTDVLILRSVDQIGTLYIEGEASYEGDPDDCLAEEADILASEEGVEDFEEIDTGETDAGGVFGVYEAVFVNEDGDEFDLIDYVECRELVEGEAVLIITFVTGEPRDFDDNFELVTEVTDTVEIAGSGSTRDDEEEEEATEEPEEEEATEEPEEEEEETATGGVDGNAYESPSYGYAIEWDDAVWEVDDESSSRGEDTLTLVSDDFGVITFVGSDTFGGDAAECYDDLEANAEDSSPDLTIIEGDEGPLRTSDPTAEFGFYVAESGSLFIFLRCSPVANDEATVSIFFAGPATEETITALLELIAELQLS